MSFLLYSFFLQLELARDLGWVRSEEEGAAIKDAHLQDLSYQQAEGAEADAQVCSAYKSCSEECRFVSRSCLYFHAERQPPSQEPGGKVQELRQQQKRAWPPSHQWRRQLERDFQSLQGNNPVLCHQMSNTGFFITETIFSFLHVGL